MDLVYCNTKSQISHHMELNGSAKKNDRGFVFVKRSIELRDLEVMPAGRRVKCEPSECGFIKE